jgi:hypothetical protein
MEKQKLKNPVMMMRRKVNTPNSGMSLASPLNLVLLKMQPTGIDWRNFSDLRRMYFALCIFCYSSFSAAFSLHVTLFFLGDSFGFVSLRQHQVRW